MKGPLAEEASPSTVGTPPLSGEAEGGVASLGAPIGLALESPPDPLVPFAVMLLLLELLLRLLMLLVLFGGKGGSGNVPLLFDSGRGGAPLVRFVLLLLLLVVLLLLLLLLTGPLATCCTGCAVTGGYGRLGGGRAAGAGDGAGGAVPASCTGLALPPMPRGPLLSGGRPVVGKSGFLGTDGVACAPGNEEARVVVVVMP